MAKTVKRRKRMRRRLLLLIASFTLAAGIGYVYQHLNELRDRQAFPPRGELVDIGTHRLHLHCQGPGDRTVILEAGLGNMVLAWTRVQPVLAREFTVCAYDRAGLGHSEAGPFPRSGPQVVTELGRLIEAAGLRGPFILVGHSNGALYARLFERRWPDQVVGMVLVDPSPENAPTCDALPSLQRAVYGTLVRLADFGVPRLLLPHLFPIRDNHSPAEKAEFGALRSQARFLRALWSEQQQTCDLRRMANDGGPPAEGLPVIVLSAADRSPGEGRRATDLHSAWVADVEHAELRVVENAGHWIQRDRADEVIAAVRDVASRSD